MLMLRNFCLRSSQVCKSLSISNPWKSKQFVLRSEDLRLFKIRNYSQPPKKEERGHAKGIGPISWRGLCAIFVLGGISVLGVMYVRREKELAIEKERKRILGKAAIGGTFDLIDHNGKPCSSKDFFGKWVLLYFGFTHCPDVCPDELEKLVRVVDTLNSKPELTPVQPLFITVDPERDNVQAVSAYVKEFSPQMIGLTGTLEQVNKVAKSFRVYYSAGPKDVDQDYIVDHTIIIYLLNPEGEFVDYYGQSQDHTHISEAVQLQMLKYQRAKSSWFK